MSTVELDWKLRFAKLLFHYDPKRIRVNEAHSLKENFIPNGLYKYRSFSDSHLDALERDVLYQSAPVFFNDPYDSAIYFEPQRMLVEDLSLMTREQRDTLFKEAHANPEATVRRPFINPITSAALRAKFVAEMHGVSEDQMQSLVKGLAEIDRRLHEQSVTEMGRFLRSNYSVISFTEDPSSVLMWSHYSANHTGFCIEYNMSPSDERQRFIRRICYPVFYRKKLLDISRHLFKKDVDSFNNLVGLFTCILKSDEWAYEREWRMVLPVGEANANVAFNMPAPSALILGISSTAKDEERLRAISRSKNIPLKRMHQHYNAFRLEVRDA